MLAYVKEVNICLEMLEAEQYPVQMMDKKEKELSDYHTENILQLARSKEFLQVKGNLFGDKSQAASKDLSNLEIEEQYKNLFSIFVFLKNCELILLKQTFTVRMIICRQHQIWEQFYDSTQIVRNQHLLITETSANI